MRDARRNDPFMRHRRALALFAEDGDGEAVSLALRELRNQDAAAFADFLIEQGLAGHWHHKIETHAAHQAAPPGFSDTLKDVRFPETAAYLAQRRALEEVDAILNEEGIRYAVLKGAWVREVVYPDPALRPSADVDLLVAPEDRAAAARLLVGAGFAEHPLDATGAHEMTLSRGGVDIDLHWEVVRPYRTRAAIAEPLLARRQRHGVLWGPSDADTAFVLLVHPAFAKYVCSPNMALMRVVDALMWFRARSIDWNAVGDRLDETGLAPAAWMMVEWLDMLVGEQYLQIPLEFRQRVRPGAVRRRYLRYWLDHDLPTRLFERPLLVQVGLTLMLHQQPSDVARAVIGKLRSRGVKGAELPA